MPPQREFELTGEQQALLNHEPGRHARVLAGPGTGKSAMLVALVDRLLRGSERPRVRLLTFTRAATAELADKVSEHPAAAAELPSTIHSFATSVLVRNRGVGGFPEPLRIADSWEERKVIHPTLARRAGVTVRRLRDLIAEMAAGWERLEPWEHPSVDPEIRTRFLGAWHEHRQVYGYTLLSELPYALRRALNDHEDLEGVDYDMLVVDEYQDLNACDLDILSLIAQRGCSIIGAGDDDQSIYSFRWAAPFGIRRFPQDYTNASDYKLSITQRCGRRIIEWANHVIQGDPERPPKPPLTSRDGAPDGEVALLAFNNEQQEAEGVCALVQGLIRHEGLDAEDILILLRSDHNNAFSGPIKTVLQDAGIAVSDPDLVEQMLGSEENRRLLEIFRLLVNRRDSIAWAGLLHLTPGVGTSFMEFLYQRALDERCQLGDVLLSAYDAGFPDAPRSAECVQELPDHVIAWLDSHPLPERPEDGWGHWILGLAGDNVVPAPSAGFADLLREVDDIAEEEQTLDRYLGQIMPLGKDLRQTRGGGVRIMTMGGAKGLTTCATIIVGLERGLVPRRSGRLDEERRLLYVGMTRPREYLYGTWARRRRGPTARAGDPNVGERRNYSEFLDGGPVQSQDGRNYIRRRWRD